MHTYIKIKLHSAALRQESISTRFPITSLQMGKLPTCCRLVSDVANYLDISSCCNKLAAGHDIWETTWHNKQNLSQTCYGETGIMDFGLYEMKIYLQHFVVVIFTVLHIVQYSGRLGPNTSIQLGCLCPNSSATRLRWLRSGTVSWWLQNIV